MVKDMTNGKPLKLILSFCLPMLMGNLFQQFYNMVDTIVVGRYVGIDALAAVGSTGSLNFLVIGFVVGICSGFSINVAQAFGAGRHSDMRRYVANSFYLCAVFAVILTAVTMIFTRPLLRLMKTPDDIIDLAYDYIIIIFAGIVVIMLYNLLSSIMRSLGDSRTPLFFLIISSVLNVILDLLFVRVFDLGVKGVGYATVIAQAVSALLCLFFIRHRVDILRFEKGELSLDFKKCGKLLRIGVPMALQFSITAVGSIILQTAVNSLGKTIVAAVTAANKIQMIVTQPMETLGITMATYCGQNLGAGKVDRINKGLRQSLIIGLVYSVAAFAIVVFLGQYIALLFIKKSDMAIIGDISHFLFFSGMFYWVLAVLFILRNSLQGLGFSFLPMLAGLSELAARCLVAFGFVKTFGYDAVCLASPVAWLFADILLIIVAIIKVRELNRKFGVVTEKVGRKKREKV